MVINVKSHKIDSKIRYTISTISKINLGLEILQKFQDGYHHILSYFVPIDFGDELTFSFLTQQNFSLNYTDSLPLGYGALLQSAFTDNLQSNLLYKTYHWLFNLTQDLNFWKKSSVLKNEIPNYMTKWGVHIDIIKKVPSPCGLGGGSGDAASLLEAFIYLCSHFFSENVVLMIKNTLFQYVHELGTDVPLLFLRSQGILNGKYECVPSKERAKYIGILGIPQESCSTEKMYNQISSKYFTKIKPQIKKVIHDMDNLKENFTTGILVDDNCFIKGRQELKNAFVGVLEHLQPSLYKRITEYYEILLDTAISEFLEYFHKNGLSVLENDLRQKIEKCCFVSLSGSGSAFYLCIPISIFQRVFSLISIDCLSLILFNILDTLYDIDDLCHWEVFRSVE